MRRLSLFVLCAVLQAVVLSTGCGGGDDPVPDAGPPPVPDSGPPTPDAGPKPDAGPTDLLPPSILTYSPANNATGVLPESQIVVTFSEAMQVDRGTLQIIPGTGLPNGGLLTAKPQDWDPTRRTVSFSFPNGLPLKARLTVYVANFSDLAGNPLLGTVTFSFTVSDGPSPTVSSSSPAEGASSVPLGTSEITLNFNQTMDTSVGTLVPGPGLTLGPKTWVGNQSLKAPITSALVNDVVYSVRLDNFRNITGKALDGAPYLGDGELDFGTGPDTIVPTVNLASPPEGATDVQYDSTQLVVITFSEPMDTAVGKAELVDGTTRTTLTPVWSADGFKASYDVRFKLRPGATLKVTLTGFKDRAGNLFNPTPYLGNGSLDFSVAPDTVKPYVTETDVPDGATDVYPVEVYASGGNAGYRKIFIFKFSEPMDPSVTLVTLHESLNPSSFRNLAGVFSADGLTMTLTILPPGAGQLPMVDNRAYYLDLTRLKDPQGNLLDTTIPVLGNGKLEFRTLLDQPDLDHACTHALTQTPLAVSATGTAGANTPRTDQLHVLYELTLPGSGTNFSGYTRAQLAFNRTQPIFMSGQVTLAASDSSTGTGFGVSLVPVPPACSAITYQATFGVEATSVDLKFGPSAQSKLRIILEDAF